MRFLPVALLLALVLASCVGDEGPPPSPLAVYEDGRAAVLARTDSGQGLRIEHEPFDTVMTEPMVMELPLEAPREAEGIEAGDKIRFDLALGQNALGQGYRLRNVERLPASTSLNLTADTAAANATDGSP
jgi:PBP1b-binding outer membrane lipoprotein LpoB